MIPAVPSIAPVCLTKSLRPSSIGASATLTALFSPLAALPLESSIFELLISSLLETSLPFQTGKINKASDCAVAQWDAFVHSILCQIAIDRVTANYIASPVPKIFDWLKHPNIEGCSQVLWIANPGDESLRPQRFGAFSLLPRTQMQHLGTQS